ncbi:carboxylesterase family protein [Portibacter marinus]|uniref:carboxylesterase family protein n=1 Tax=Portibacter marinus TaxID=2898660 RepID=UPI001F293EA3|nr:alpha/beta hydrolase [Portibacter marinus]
MKTQIPGRYIDEVFTEITETNDVVFSTNVPQPRNNNLNLYSIITGLPVAVKEYDLQNVTLRMDIFEPTDDQITERPLIIICFGGGFVQGSRDYWSIRLLAEGLARRGYVTATIDYRLGMNLFDKDLGARAVYRGIQDSRSAIRFFRANAAQYKIDTDKIFIGGHSAGAFIALHNVYMDKDTERPLSTRIWTQNAMNDCPDQGCLDCVGDNLGYDGKANGLFSLAGAVGDLQFIESNQEPPPILFHSQDDGTVPYNIGEPFSDISGLIVGSDLPIVYGSLPISQRCQDLGLPVMFNSYANRGHGVHENGTIVLHEDIIPEITSWFFGQYLEPVTATLQGQTKYCSENPSVGYSLNADNFVFFDWQLEGGELIGDNSSHEVEVTWNPDAPENKLTVTPYLSNGTQGATQTIAIELADGEINEWIGGDGDWMDPGQWSNHHPPLSCQEVIFPVDVNITVPQNEIINIKTLTLNPNTRVQIPGSSELRISGN